MRSLYEEAIKLADSATEATDKTIASLDGCECPVCEMIASLMKTTKARITEQRAELTKAVLDDPEEFGVLLCSGAVGFFSGHEASAIMLEQLADAAHEAYNILRSNTLAGMGAIHVSGTNLDELAKQVREKLAELGVPEDDGTPRPTQPMPKGWN